jgi:DHA2 family multidrug resistance protein
MSNKAPETGSTKHSPWIIAVVATIATFMEVLDTTITNVSLAHIAGTLASSSEESTWVLTSYLVSNGIILPLSGWLAGVMGRKLFFMVCIAGFTITSFACGAATSLASLILFRLVQGIAGGGLQPTQQAIVLDAFPKEKRGMAFGVTGITMIVAPIIGPTLGGWITDNFSWRWIFFINIPVGILALYFVNKYIEDPQHAKAKGFKSVDYFGLLLVFLGLGALQIVLDKGQIEDWFESNFIVFFAIISVVGIIGAVVWILKTEDPLIDFYLFKHLTFSLGCIMIFVTGFVLYSSSVLLPLLVQTQFGYTATLAGLILSPAAIIVVVLMPISGILVSKVPVKYLIGSGFLLTAFGMWNTHFVTPHTDYYTFVMMRVTQVMGLPFLFVPISTVAFIEIPKEKYNKASALYSLCRNLGGSFGIALITTYVVRDIQRNQSIMAHDISEGDALNQAALDKLTNDLMDKGLSELEASNQALAMLYQEFVKQTTVLAYQEAFLVLAGLLLICAFIAFFLLPANEAKKPDSEVQAH